MNNIEETFRINLKKYLKEKKKTQRELAEYLGVSTAVVNYYVKGKNTPRMDKIDKISEFFGVQRSDLIGQIDINEPQTSILDTKIQNTINQLNNENKQKTYNYASNLLENQNNEIHELTQVYVTEKVAAGVGYSYGENEGTFYYTDRDDLPSYDFATLVKGDSMTPDYEDGDVILLRQGYDSINGDIYVIDYDGKSYVKKLYNDGTRFVLRSLNENYDDIVIYLTDDTYFNIVGKVIDSFKPVRR